MKLWDKGGRQASAIQANRYKIMSEDNQGGLNSPRFPADPIQRHWHKLQSEWSENHSAWLTRRVASPI